MFKSAVLALADGRVFHGQAVGISGTTTGEVVFNTAMTGYQEILTDPSYARQIITLTYPHIGNVGTNHEDEEAKDIVASGLVIRDLPRFTSHWRSRVSLGDYLQQKGVVAIAGLDTRALTRCLREKGAQNGCIMAGEQIDPDTAVRQAQAFPGLKGLDLAKVVSTPHAYAFAEGTWRIGKGFSPQEQSDDSRDGGGRAMQATAGMQEVKALAATGQRREQLPGAIAEYQVVAYDYGIKRNILRMLVDCGIRVRVVPAQTSAAEVIALKPDGVFLSNGPGDPEPCTYAIDAIRTLTNGGLPVFGICLGHQLLALASGARTLKMKFGHHGANHPVQDLESGAVFITSQNHGFAVDESSLPPNVKATHRSLFDGSLQGIQRTDTPAFSFQGHPEASPGPHDMAYLFARFTQMMQEYRMKHA